MCPFAFRPPAWHRYRRRSRGIAFGIFEEFAVEEAGDISYGGSNCFRTRMPKQEVPRRNIWPIAAS